MKRNYSIITILLTVSMLLLVACGEITSTKTPELAVMKMYQAAVDNDQETLNKLLTYYVDSDGDNMNIAQELKEQAYDLGGLESVKPTSLAETEMQEEVIEGLNETFQGNWNFVYVELDESYIYAWIVQEIDGGFYIVDGEDFSTDEIFLVVDGINIDEERASKQAAENAEVEARQQEELRLAREEANQLLGTWTGTAIAPQQSLEMNITGLGETELEEQDGEKVILTPFHGTARLFMDPSTVSYSGWHPVTVDITLRGNHVIGISDGYRDYATIEFEVVDQTQAPERDFELHGIHFYPTSIGVDDDDLYEDYFLNGEMQGGVSVSDRVKNTEWSLEKVE